MTPGSFFLLLTVALFVLGCNSAAPQVRYINSLPQFGDANFTVAIPFVNLFTNIGPGTITPYAATNTGNWNFFSSYTRLIYAGSDQFITADDAWYTVFTYQNGANQVKNLLIVDQSTPPTGNKAAIRVLNLAQYNYPINATVSTSSSSSAKQAWNNVAYATASGYAEIEPGTYIFDWTSAVINKRSILQNNCTPGTPGCHTTLAVKASKSYTYVVLASVDTVVVDGTTSSRSVKSKRNIPNHKVLLERLSLSNKVNNQPQETDDQGQQDGLGSKDSSNSDPTK